MTDPILISPVVSWVITAIISTAIGWYGHKRHVKPNKPKRQEYEYKILEASDKESIERLINSHPSLGWSAQGGICVSSTRNGVAIFSQAIVKGQPLEVK